MQARSLDEHSSRDQSMALCWHRHAVRACQALQHPPAEGTSRQGSACLSSPGSANTPAALELEVNPKQAKSLSIG